MTDNLPPLTPGDPPPADVVPRPPLTLGTLRRLNDLAGQHVTVTTPGQVIEDADGIPIGVEPSATTEATMAGAVFTRAELDRLGGHPDNFPNLRFIEPEKGTDHDQHTP